MDRDALRSASNRFFYRRPELLPSAANANVLSSAGHSFSRVFTDGFLYALAHMFATIGTPNPAAFGMQPADDPNAATLLFLEAPYNGAR